MAIGKVFAPGQLRDAAGVGSIINSRHEGPTKHPTEEKAFRSLENRSFSPPVKPKKETPMNNPGFMGVVEPSEKKG